MIFTAPFVLLCTVSLCSTLVIYLVNPIFSDYAVAALGTTIGTAGVLVGMANFGSLILFPFYGPANNRLDRKKLMMAAMLLMFVATVGYATVTSIPLLMVFRLLLGFCTGIVNTTGMVMVVETLPENRITQGVGYYGLAGIVMGAVGPSITIAIVDHFGYRMSFWMAAMSALIGLVVAWKLPSSGPGQRGGADAPAAVKSGTLTVGSLFREMFARESLLPASIGLMFAIANAIQIAFMVPYGKVYGLEDGVGLYFLVLAAGSFSARLLFTKYMETKTIAFVAAAAGVFLISMPLLLGLGRSMATMLLAGAAFGIGYGILLPVTQSTAVKFAPRHRRGSGSNTYFTAINLAFTLGPVMGGYMAQHFGYAHMFLALVVPSSLAVVLGLVKGRVPVSPEPSREQIRADAEKNPG